MIAVSLNVGSSVRLMKPSKLCMSTQNTAQIIGTCFLQVLLPGVVWYWCKQENREPCFISRADINIIPTNMLPFHKVAAAQAVETLNNNT